MDIQAEVESIKQELTEILVAKLKENKIEPDKARQFAADFLAVLPIRDQQDLLLKLKNLGQQYEDARAIYVRELGKFNEEARNQTLTQLHELIRQGNIDEALAIAKKYHNN